MRIERLAEIVEVQEAAPVDTTPLKAVVDKYRKKKGNVIPVLQGAQAIYGYLPEEAFVYIAKELGHKLSDLYGVATFYAQFRLNPVGKHIIKVCHGTACHVQNATKISEALMDHLEVKDGETTEDGLFTLESVACLGCCSLAPVMMVDDETHGKLTNTNAVKIIRRVKIADEKAQQEN